MADRYILAVDLGTSGPKVALVAASGRVLACVTEPTELLLLPGGGAEQDPEDWWRAIKTGITRVLAKAQVPAKEIVAIACTAQWAGTVPVDRDGKALQNALIWMDSRGAKYIPPITGGMIRIEGYGVGRLGRWLRRTGGIPSLAGKEPVAHILFLRNERPEIYERTHRFLEPKDYLNLRLTGRMVATYDSIALHWVTDNRNIDAIDYDPQLLAMTTIERDKLPDLARATDVIGTLRKDVAEELGLHPDVKVVGGTPDVQSAAVGSGAVKDYDPHLYIGTSSWVTCHVPFKKTDILHAIASLPSALPGRYFAANSQETAGACMAWLRDNLLFPRDEGSTDLAPADALLKMNALASSVPAGADKLIFTPWLYGERSPVASKSMRAMLFNQSLETTRAHVVRAVMEGVAYNTRWLYGYVEKFCKRRFESIRMIGGGANSNLWCQIFADVLDREVHQVAQPVQANVRGAAFVAALGLGDITVDDIPDRVPVARKYAPNKDHRALYDDLFAEYMNLYKAGKAIFDRLNRG